MEEQAITSSAAAICVCLSNLIEKKGSGEREARDGMEIRERTVRTEEETANAEKASIRTSHE